MRRACGFWALRRTVTALTVAGGSVSWRMCPTASSPGPVGKTRVVGPCARPRVKAVMGMAIGAAAITRPTSERNVPHFVARFALAVPRRMAWGSAPLRAHRSGGSGSALRVVGGGCAQVRSARGGPGGHGRGCWFRCGSELRLVGHRAAGGRGSAPRAVGGDLRPGVSSPTLGGPGGLAVSRSGCPGAARWRFGSPSGWARAVGWSLLAVDMVASTACRMSWVAASGCDTNEG